MGVNIMPFTVFETKYLLFNNNIRNSTFLLNKSVNYLVTIENFTTRYYVKDRISNNASLLDSQSNESGSDWGPNRDPLYIVMPVTIIYVLIFFTGVIGNISTCIVIAKNKSMHTATNYYLFSLAVSDLLLLISGLPTEIYYIWSNFPYIFGEAFCILQGFAAETSANATVLTITAFTIERYVAICHPFLSHTMSKLSRAIRFIVGIWLVAMCLAVPQAMSFGILYETNAYGHVINKDHSVCTIRKLIIPHAFEISTFVFFIAPMSLITVLYILIGVQLHRTTLTRSNTSGDSVRLKHRLFEKKRNSRDRMLGQTVVIVTPATGRESIDSEKVILDVVENEEGRKNFPRNAQIYASKHVVKMLVAVVVAFFVCWAPFHAQRLLAVHGEMQRDRVPFMVTAFRILTYVSGIFYYLSTTINPLLYHIMSHKFREAFKSTFAKCLRCDHCETDGKYYSNLSGNSSQPNSQSGNTDSQCSRQSSFRYLEADVARLQMDTRRPLVVTFRRRKPQMVEIHAQTKKINDIYVSITTDQLVYQHKHNDHYQKENSKGRKSHRTHKAESIKDNWKLDYCRSCAYDDCYINTAYVNSRQSPSTEHNSPEEDDDINLTVTNIQEKNKSFVQNNLQPKHICPRSFKSTYIENDELLQRTGRRCEIRRKTNDENYGHPPSKHFSHIDRCYSTNDLNSDNQRTKITNTGKICKNNTKVVVTSNNIEANIDKSSSFSCFNIHNFV